MTSLEQIAKRNKVSIYFIRQATEKLKLDRQIEIFSEDEVMLIEDEINTVKRWGR